MSADEFDKGEYERRQNRALEAVAQQVRKLVTFDQTDRGPVVEFVCPKGHSLKRYRVAVDHIHGGALFLEPLPGLAGRRGPVARNGSPLGKAKTVCDASGCPKINPCPDHPQQEEVLDLLRTQFVCTCGWSDAFTAARLMKVYGAAVALGLSSVPVTFSEPSRR